MNALIIEDEKAAVRNLTALLSEAAPHIGVVAVLDSIAESIDWFRANAMPDLIFLDIHLADGSAFEIFEHVDISCPIIFTTAYDEYARLAGATYGRRLANWNNCVRRHLQRNLITAA